MLGRVGGFGQGDGAGECDGGCVTLCGFVAAEGGTVEALEVADRLLDARAAPVERAWEEARSIRRVVPTRDHWADPPLAGRGAVALRVAAFAGEGRPRPEVGTDVQQRLERAAVARRAAGQRESKGPAGEVGLDVDLGREPAARAAERLTVLPPWAPAAETRARSTVEADTRTRCAVALSEARASRKASSTPERPSRQSRPQTLFQVPNPAGNARQVTLWTAKQRSAPRSRRPSRPLSPRREQHPRTTSSVTAQSASLIPVRMAGPPQADPP